MYFGGEIVEGHQRTLMRLWCDFDVMCQRHGEPRLPREASAPDSLCLVADFIVPHGKALDVPLWCEMLAAIRIPALSELF